MPKRLQKHVLNELHSSLLAAGLIFLFIFFLESCHSSHKACEPPPDRNPLINWLQVHEHPGWDSVTFNSDPADPNALAKEIMKIKLYVRGWIAEYDDSVKKAPANPLQERSDYVVDSFAFREISRSPLIYNIQAFLKPNARAKPHPDDEPAQGETHGPGGHIIPPPPPPPGK